MLSKSKQERIEKQIFEGPGGIGFAQNLFFGINELQEKKIKVDDFIQAFKLRQQQLLESDRMADNDAYMVSAASPLCPKCGHTLFIMEVNTSKRDVISNKEAKSLWQCPECLYDFESVLTVHQYRKIAIKNNGQTIKLEK